MMFEFNEYWPVEVYENYNSFLEGFLAENFEDFGYVCYMEGKNLLLRLSYCWHTAMKELHHVSLDSFSIFLDCWIL